MSELRKWPVKVYIYDLSKGMARSLSQAFLGKQIDGIWHSGIVVYGREFFYGGTGGIESCSPGGIPILGPPDIVADLGNTEIPYDMYIGYLSELNKSTFRPEKYHLLDNNCNTFSSEAAQFLTGNDIPSYVTGLPADVMSTPFGQMIKPWIDVMSVNPSGGQSVFSTDSSSKTSPPEDTFLTSLPPGSEKTDEPQGATYEPQGATCKPPGATNFIAEDSERSDFSDEFKVESDEDDKEVDEPIVFKDKIPEQKKLKEELSGKLSGKDIKLISELYEYLEDMSRSWSLSKDHVQTIHTVVGDGGIGDKTRQDICVLLESLVLIEDFIMVLQHEPTKLIFNIIEHFEHVTEKIQIALLKAMTNCSSTVAGHSFLTNENSKGTNMLHASCKMCVSCLLQESNSIYDTASAFAFNLSRIKIADDSQVEVGSAILECLQKELSEPTAYTLMKSLLRLMDANAEMCDLAGVVGMNCSVHEKLSPRLQQLCEEAREKTAL